MDTDMDTECTPVDTLWLFQCLSRRLPNASWPVTFSLVALLQSDSLLLLYYRDTCILSRGLMWFRLH